MPEACAAQKTAQRASWHLKEVNKCMSKHFLFTACRRAVSKLRGVFCAAGAVKYEGTVSAVLYGTVMGSYR